jgi:kynurenine formamidase
MCVSGTPGANHHRHHHHDPTREVAATDPSLSRRAFLKAGAVGAAGLGLAAAPLAPALAAASGRSRRVVDLTHRLTKTFPSFLGPQAVFDEVLFTIPDDGFYTKQWTFDEHIGTHIDTPGHFSLGSALVDELDPDTLVAPLVVVDVKAKAAEDPNTTVGTADLVSWERGHGRIPRGALVCMNSGWASKIGDGDGFRGGTGFPDLNFPGFSADAADWLIAKRDVVGIGVDTMSIDPGSSSDFAVHVGFLGSGRYGIENLNNLDDIPANGALGFVGPVPWEEGSGSPCKVLAVLEGRGR